MKQVELVNGPLRFPALLTGDGEPVILSGQFTSINRQPHLVVMTATSKLAVIGCTPQP